ncbi:MAG: Abi family protein [Bacteriovoracaceae bacterium]|nr:Abi family protein [Bacteriovoracaceae bacterium]
MVKTIEELISSERLEGYRSYSHNHLDARLIRYNYNIEMSRSFYAPLNILEVSLRNTLHKAFSDYLKDQHWLLKYESHSIIQKSEQHKIREAVDKLIRKKRTLEDCRIIAELSFSFWVNLYDRPYLEIHKSNIRTQFPEATNSQRDIFKIKKSLREIRNLRNRIFHYEPIWHWTNLGTYHHQIKELISWMNRDLLLKSFSDSERDIEELLKRQAIMLK